MQQYHIYCIFLQVVFYLPYKYDSTTDSYVIYFFLLDALKLYR